MLGKRLITLRDYYYISIFEIFNHVAEYLVKWVFNIIRLLLCLSVQQRYEKQYTKEENPPSSTAKKSYPH